MGSICPNEVSRQDQAITGFSFAGSAVTDRLQNDKDVIVLAYFDSS